MRARTRSIFSLFAGGLVFAACSEPNTPVEPKARPAPAAVGREPRADGYIVILKPGASFTRARVGSRLGNVMSLDPASTAQDAIVSDLVPTINGFVVRGAASAADISGPDVADVVPNYEADIIDPVPFDAALTEFSGPADPLGTDQSGAGFFANNTQWGYKKISANRAWVPSRGGAGAKVCITDSGIDPGHQTFVGKAIQSASFIANSSAQTDTNGHGSHVAGTISTNGVGAASVAPNVSLMTAKIFNGAGGGATAAVTINAVAWCVDNGADVINMSIGFTGGIPTTPGNLPFIAAYEAGLDYATNNGVLIVASAGNDGVTMPFAGRIFLPAEAPGVTSVAATSPTTNLAPFGINAIWSAPGAAFDGIASYSNRGGVPSVDISAPGGDLFSGWPIQSLIISACSRQFRSGATFPCAAGNVYLFNAGTSMASPHVAGVAGLIRGRWPSSVRSTALRSKIESCLYRAVDNIGSTAIFGRGRVNAYKAATQPC
jgi:subtilisin family serine protease